MEIKTLNIEELISPDYNPRSISDTELTKLKNSLTNFGYIDPIIVNKVNNHIVGGNQRYLALKELGYKKVDVVYVTFNNMDEEKAANIALNKISGDWDYTKLNQIFEELKTNHFDIELTGFDDIELTNEFNIDLTDNDSFFDEQIPEEEPIFDESIADDVQTFKCPHCGYEIPTSELQ